MSTQEAVVACNSPGEALHVGASRVSLRPPVPGISEITDRHTETHTRNTAINIIDYISETISIFHCDDVNIQKLQ